MWLAAPAPRRFADGKERLNPIRLRCQIISFDSSYGLRAPCARNTIRSKYATLETESQFIGEKARKFCAKNSFPVPQESWVRFRGKVSSSRATMAAMSDTKVRRYIVANGKVYDERFYLALKSMLEFALPGASEPYKLLYIVKENGAGRSYLITSHRRGKRRLIECGIPAHSHVNRWTFLNEGREDFMPRSEPSCYPELRAKAEEFRKEFSGPIA